MSNKFSLRKNTAPIKGNNTSSKKKDDGKMKKWWRSLPQFLRKSIIAVFLTTFLTVFFVGMTFLWYCFIYLDAEFGLSNIDNSLDYTTVVYAYDKNNQPIEIETLHKSENRIWVDFDEIPENLRWAFIAIEDKRFYEHNGVDLRRTLHAVFNFFNVKSSNSFGGSTITQQLIKNLTGDDAHTITRKIQEMRRAWYLERECKKDQILEAYLNTIYLSQGCSGVQTAARYYFDKAVGELTLGECASLAAITKYPATYDPLVNPDKNKSRAATILNEMVDLKIITEEQATAAKEEEIVYKKGTIKQTDDIYQSYFVDQIITDVIKDLMVERGYSETYATNLLYSGGLKIYSTMDIDVQEQMDKIYKNRSSFPKLKGEVQPQSAMVIIDNSTGAVAAMAGGIGEKDRDRGFNRATSSYLQPGSSIKPISTYAPAFEYSVSIEGKQISPGTLVLDSYLNPSTRYPKNYDAVTNEPMTITRAISLSKNTIAAKVNVAVGFKRSIGFMRDNLGVTSLITSDMNKTNNDEGVGPLALGGLTKGISVLEIAAAYSAFPNQGTYTKPYTYTKVVDQNGKVILEKRIESKSAMSKDTADIMNMMLHTAATTGTGTPANFSSTAVAGKTGTTDDNKDRWFVGYTSYYTAAVWFGYDQPQTVIYSGANPAATTWKKVMQPIHKGLKYKSFATPQSLVSITYCVESGLIANEACPEKAIAQFYSNVVPTEHCNIHIDVIEPDPKDDGQTETKDPDDNDPIDNNTNPDTNPDDEPPADVDIPPPSDNPWVLDWDDE